MIQAEMPSSSADDLRASDFSNPSGPGTKIAGFRTTPNLFGVLLEPAEERLSVISCRVARLRTLLAILGYSGEIDQDPADVLWVIYEALESIEAIADGAIPEQLPDGFDPLAKVAKSVAVEPGHAAVNASSDTVLSWLANWIERDPAFKSPHSELYRNYTDWCAEQKQPAETTTGFGRTLSKLGFTSYKTKSGTKWRKGLRLLD